MATTKKEKEVMLPGTNQYYQRTNINPTTSGQASAALGNTINNAPGQYTASAAVNNAYNQLQNTIDSKPDQYQSQYNDKIQNLLDSILTQKDFSYDFNSDKLYQNYKNQYMQQGKQAMLDTQAAANANTGGFGSSYAESVGSQAYQQYLTQLNDKIPQLYQLALQKYQMDTDKMHKQLSAVGTQEDREYGKYRDSVTDWQADRNYGLTQYNTMYNQDYGAYRDQVSDYYNDRDFYANQQNNLWNQEFSKDKFDYQKYRDSVSDNHWQQSFDYQKNRDSVSDSHWQQSFDYNSNRDNVSDSHWQQSFDYQKDRDAISDSQWEKQFTLSRQKAASSGSKRSSSSATGKKLSTEIKKNMQLLDGDELDEYMGSLVEAGYSFDELMDYMIQINKSMVYQNTSKKTRTLPSRFSLADSVSKDAKSKG